MKKMFLVFLLLLSFFIFVGCNKQDLDDNNNDDQINDDDEDKELDTFIVKVYNQGSKIIFEKEIEFDEEDNFYELLKSDQDIQLGTAESSFGDYVISVCGVEANDDAFLYWAIYVNDEYLQTGISEITLKKDDVLKFELTSYYVPVETIDAVAEKNELRVDEYAIITYQLGPEFASVQTVKFSSSDESVLTVDNEGKVLAVGKGIASVTIKASGASTIIDFNIRHKKLSDMSVEERNALSDEDYEELLLEQEQEEKQLLEIESKKLLLSLEELVPSETTENIDLPWATSVSGLKIYWTSSNRDAIDENGNVNRRSFDASTILTATISTIYETFNFTKEVLIKGFDMPSLSNEKLTFAYLMDSSFSNIREEDYEKLDVINYSFGYIVNGTVTTSNLANINEILYARQNGVRVVLSIGGWGADGFSQAVSTKENRNVFISSIIDIIKKYDFDGVDLDWEYPGSTAGGVIIADPANDKHNFSLLLKELRDALDLQNKDLILSAAVPGGSVYLYEVPELNKYLDYLHIMSYDLSKQGTSSHHSALYSSAHTSSSADLAVRLYSEAGFSKEKMVIGGAFYGYKSTVGSAGLATNGIGVSNANGSTISYTNIASSILTNPNFVEYYDNVAKAYWLYDGETFISYENERSLTYKVEYVVENNLAGIMFWDYNNDKTGTLLEAIYQAYNNN